MVEGSCGCDAETRKPKERAVSIGASPAPSVSATGAMAAVEVDVQGRWDALALYQLLAPFRSFLVQHTMDRWVIHASAPGCQGEPLAEALDAIDVWCAERRLDPSVRVDSQPRRHGWHGDSSR
jgi:hypothetical protein